MGMTSKGGIKSIQRGTLNIANGTIFNSATISSVDTTKAELRLLGYTGNSGAGASPLYDFMRISLSNETTIGATRLGTLNDLTASWEVTEWF